MRYELSEFTTQTVSQGKSRDNQTASRAWTSPPIRMDTRGGSEILVSIVGDS